MPCRDGMRPYPAWRSGHAQRTLHGRHWDFSSIASRVSPAPRVIAASVLPGNPRLVSIKVPALIVGSNPLLMGLIAWRYVRAQRCCLLWPQPVSDPWPYGLLDDGDFLQLVIRSTGIPGVTTIVELMSALHARILPYAKRLPAAWRLQLPGDPIYAGQLMIAGERTSAIPTQRSVARQDALRAELFHGVATLKLGMRTHLGIFPERVYVAGACPGFMTAIAAPDPAQQRMLAPYPGVQLLGGALHPVVQDVVGGLKNALQDITEINQLGPAQHDHSL